MILGIVRVHDLDPDERALGLRRVRRGGALEPVRVPLRLPRPAFDLLHPPLVRASVERAPARRVGSRNAPPPRGLGAALGAAPAAAPLLPGLAPAVVFARRAPRARGHGLEGGVDRAREERVEAFGEGRGGGGGGGGGVGGGFVGEAGRRGRRVSPPRDSRRRRRSRRPRGARGRRARARSQASRVSVGAVGVRGEAERAGGAKRIRRLEPGLRREVGGEVELFVHPRRAEEQSVAVRGRAPVHAPEPVQRRARRLRLARREDDGEAEVAQDVGGDGVESLEPAAPAPVARAPARAHALELLRGGRPVEDADRDDAVAEPVGRALEDQLRDLALGVEVVRRLGDVRGVEDPSRDVHREHLPDDAVEDRGVRARVRSRVLAREHLHRARGLERAPGEDGRRAGRAGGTGEGRSGRRREGAWKALRTGRADARGNDMRGPPGGTAAGGRGRGAGRGDAPQVLDAHRDARERGRARGASGPRARE